MKGNVFQRGKASIGFEEGPLIIGCASVAGKKEGDFFSFLLTNPGKGPYFCSGPII